MQNIIYNIITYMKSSIIRKLMFFYILIIIIPVLTLGAYIQRQSASYYNRMMVIQANDYMNQRLDNIEKAISRYESIVQAVHTNTSIRNLLDTECYLGDSQKVDKINNDVKPFFSAITGITPTIGKDTSSGKELSIYKARIFFSRNQIQEVADCFYDFSRVQSIDWYSSFMNKAKINETGWNVSFTDRKFKIDTKKSEDTKSVVSVLLKMYDNRYEKVNGLIEVQINREDFFDQIFNVDSGSRKPGIIITDKNGEVVYSQFGNNAELKNQKWGSEIKDIAAFSNGIPSAIKDRYFITDSMDKTLGCTVIEFYPVGDMNNENIMNRNLIFLVLSTGFIFLTAITFLYVKTIFTKLKKLRSALKRIQKGDLDFLLESEQNDEVGELSKNFNIMIGRIKELIQTNAKIKMAEKDAQLKALQAQINPHFLYNSLNAIKMMAEIKDDLAISDAVSSLGTILRYNISGGNSDLTSLRAELSYIGHYIGIQKLLLEERADLTVTVDPKLEDKLDEYIIVKLLIQPVLENAIVHGLKNITMKGCVNIAVYKTGNDLHIKVTNNGNMIPHDELNDLNTVIHEEYDVRQDSAKGFGIGLKNVQQRIRLLYGDKYGISIASNEETGTEVDIRIPCLSATAETMP